MIKNSKILSIFLFLVLLNCEKQNIDTNINISNGDNNQFLVDLSEFKEFNLHSFDGPWEFYWMKLINPISIAPNNNNSIYYNNVFQGHKPDLIVNEFRPWTKLKINERPIPAYGYATYRTIVKIPKINTRLAIHFPHLFTASRIWVNGIEMNSNGLVSENLDEIRSSRKNSIFSFDNNSEYLEIVLQIANNNFYQGGPRGKFYIGTETGINNYIVKNIILDVLVFGLIFGSMVYHLLIYLLNKNNKPFFYFSIVCFTFLLRLPFHNTKLYDIFWNEISWNSQTLFLHIVNIISVLSAIYFLNSLFPKRIPKIIFSIYWFGALLGIIIALINEKLLSFANLYYIIIFLPIFLFHSIYLTFFKISEKKSFYLMAIGILGLGVFGLISVLLNIFGIDSGFYLIIGFLSFILFEALALSRFFTIALENRSKLKMELAQENQKALTKQREELQILMHDSLGGELTDIHVFLEKNITQNVEQFDKSVIKNIFDRTTAIIKSFRNQLLFIEDLNFAYENLFSGLNLTILRRYSDAGREVDFNLPDVLLEKKFEDEIKVNQQDLQLNLFYLFTEICTNDLKYGMGESYWDIEFHNSQIVINQKNQIKDLNFVVELIPKAAMLRVDKMKGNLRSWIDNEMYNVRISIPLADKSNL